MPSRQLPLLWICGPSGVGKSTIGWEVFQQVTREAIPVAYLDIDQLGMCYPAPESDPERHQIKARNLGVMAQNFRGAGAHCVVVSGVIDEINGIRDYVEHLSNTKLTLCRLTADPPTLTSRLAGRGQQPDQILAALSEADALDRAGFGDVCIDTTDQSIPETLGQLQTHIRDWPGREPELAIGTGPGLPETSGSIVWLCGTTAVGKSAVGWQIFDKIRKSGTRAAFLDLEQIGFYHPAPADDPENHRVKADNLAGIWHAFRQSGGEYLVIVGQIGHLTEVQLYRDAVKGTDLTLCRLEAGPEDLERRIIQRSKGVGPRLAGDALRGLTAQGQQLVLESAVATSEALQRDGIGDLSLDTRGLSAESAAEIILKRLSILDP